MWNSALQCRTLQRVSFRTCGISSTSVDGKFSASMWKICGEFRPSFFTILKNAEIIKLNKFYCGKYLRKISSAEILDLNNFTSAKYQRKLISFSNHVLDLAIFVVWLSLDQSFLDLLTFVNIYACNTLW